MMYAVMDAVIADKVSDMILCFYFSDLDFLHILLRFVAEEIGLT